MFYEYWKASGGSPPVGEQAVEVWSPLTRQSYHELWDNNGNEVTCVGGDQIEVVFSQASVTNYTAAQAAAFAASGTLGP